MLLVGGLLLLSSLRFGDGFGLIRRESGLIRLEIVHSQRLLWLLCMLNLSLTLKETSL